MISSFAHSATAHRCSMRSIVMVKWTQRAMQSSVMRCGSGADSCSLQECGCREPALTPPGRQSCVPLLGFATTRAQTGSGLHRPVAALQGRQQSAWFRESTFSSPCWTKLLPIKLKESGGKLWKRPTERHNCRPIPPRRRNNDGVNNGEYADMYEQGSRYFILNSKKITHPYS